MKKNVMGKNLRQSILKSFGRYLAIVMIIALGAAMFVGLRMTKTDMVQTGQVFTDEQNMFDLRFLSSYGWTDDQLEEARQILGLADVEAAVYQDVIVRIGTSEEDMVYRFYSLPDTVNRVELRGGRMPQAPNECLADGFYSDDSILGTEVRLSQTNEDAAFDALAYDTYTVVGYVATPLHMDLNRGSTSVGNGSLESYFYIPAEGFTLDYYTEINVTIPGDHRVYSTAYNDTLDAMTADLEPKVQAIADRWFKELIDEAEAEYADGYQQYLDGVAELEEGKLEAQQELSDAYDQLKDAEAEIADNEKLLADGEKQIADGWKELKKGEAELEDGKRQLAKAKKDAYAELDAAEAELDKNAAQVADGIAQVKDGLAQIDDGLVRINDGIAQLEEALPQLEDGIAQLEPILQALTPLMDTARQMLEELKAMPDASEEMIAALEEMVALFPQIEGTARTILDGLIASGQLDEETIAMAEEFLARLPELEEAAREALETLKEDPSQAQAMIAEIEAALAELEGMLAQYTAQLAELKAMYAEYSAQLQELYVTRDELTKQRQDLVKTLAELEDAQAQIEDGYAQLAKGRAQADREFALAEAEIAEGKRQLRESKELLTEKEKELADGRQQLEDGKVELADGWTEYEKGKLEAEQKIADGEAELADAAEELAKARQEIDDLEAPETYVLDRNTNVGYATLDSNSDIVAGVSRVFPVFFLLIAALVCITTMTRMVNEERTQIGTLKALGYSNAAIISKYLIYAGSGAILGCGLGVIAGSIVFPKIIWQAYCIMLYIEPEVQLCFDWGLCAVVVASYTAVVLGVTWYCCNSALKEVPAELIRPKAPTSGKKIFLEYLPFWEKFSFLNKVALRNIFRYRQRLLMMLIGIGGCTALLVTGFGLRDSIYNIVGFQYDEITVYDMEVYFSEGQTEEEQQRFLDAAADRTENVMFYHQESVELDHGNQIREITMIAAGDELYEFIDFRLKGDPVYLPEAGEAILSVGVAEAMGVKAGDEILLRNADMQELRVTVSAIYENYVFNFVIVRPETITQQWGEVPEMQMAFVRVGEDRDIYEVGAYLTEQEGVMNVAISQDTATMVGSMMEAMDMLVIVVVFCAALLAVIVLYNLINININERMREIATIKVLGFHSGETASYIFKENIILAVVGSLAGLYLGWWLLVFVMSQVKIDTVWFQPRVTFGSLAISVVLTMLSTFLVQFIFTFKLEKINMAEALKSVE